MPMAIKKIETFNVLLARKMFYWYSRVFAGYEISTRTLRNIPIGK